MQNKYLRGLLTAMLALGLIFTLTAPALASGNYGAQGWNLDSHEDTLEDTDILDVLDPPWLCQMEKKDGPGDNGQSGQIILTASGGSQIWIADEAAAGDVVFLGTNASWDLELVTDRWNPENIRQNCIVEIGEWDGVNFNKFNSPVQWLSIYQFEDTEVYSIYLTFLKQSLNENEIVHKGCYLAIRVRNNEEIDHVIITGEGIYSSCFSSTNGDPGYPNPGPHQMPASSLTVTGLMIGCFAVLITLMMLTRNKRLVEFRQRHF